MELDYNDIWMNKFMSRIGEIEPLSTEGSLYGAYFATDDPNVTEMVAGMVVGVEAETPEGLVTREVSLAYAGFPGKKKMSI